MHENDPGVSFGFRGRKNERSVFHFPCPEKQRPEGLFTLPAVKSGNGDILSWFSYRRCPSSSL